jgi:hypothetical protein
MNPKLKVLFIYKDRSEYGKAYGLANSATFVSEYLTNLGIDSSIEVAVDGNSIDRLVTQYDPTHVIIEALWVAPNKLKELLEIHRHKKRSWIIRLHSRPVFIANEGIAFTWLSDYKQLRLRQLTIAPNTEEFAHDLSFFGLKTAHLPNVYYPTLDMVPKKKFNGHTIDVGCFGAIRPMKNHMTQAMAAVNFAKDKGLHLNFHVNKRMEGGGDNVLKNLHAFFENYKCSHYHLVEHNWHSHKDFLNLIRNMDMGLQVSLTETFNIVSADFVSAGVPVVGSSQITWLPRMFQADPNSTESIKKKMEFAWSWAGYTMRYLSERGLNISNKVSEKAWIKFLEV